MLRDWNFIISFADADRIAEPGHGQCGWGLRVIGLPLGLPRHMKSVYSTLFLDKRKSGKFQITVKNAANGRCLCGYVYFTHIRRGNVGYGRIAYFRVRLCAFARSTVMGIPEPPFVERANSMALTLLLYKPINCMPFRERCEGK